VFYLFNQTTDAQISLIGKKAASLVAMTAWGLPVPEGGVVSTEGFDAFISLHDMDKIVQKLREEMRTNPERVWETAECLRERIAKGELPEKLKQSIKNLLKANPDFHFAVRSSGTKEDLDNASFAGQYTTILNVKPGKGIYNSVKECWASLFNERVLNYCINRNIDFSDMKIAVIIQKMIPAEKSGVLFTVDPLKGYDRQMIIEACFGLGEALVGGEVTPDQYGYDWYNGVEKKRVIGDKKIAVLAMDDPPFVKHITHDESRRHETVLSREEVKQLSDIALKIQAEYGFPVDIEWAKHDNQFYILQSRPITTISYGGINNEWTTADFRDGGVSSGVCSPFMWSLYDLVWEKVMPSYLKQHYLIESDKGVIWGDMFYGRPYWNLSSVKEGLKRLPGFIEKNFDESLGIRVAYKGEGFTSRTNVKTLLTGIKVLLELSKSFKKLKKEWPIFREQQHKKLLEIDQIDPETMKQDEFFKFYETFIMEEYYRSEATYFNTIFASSNTASLFKERLKKIESRLIYPNLISGLTNLSHLIPMYELWDLRETIKMDAASVSFWKETSVDDLVSLWRSGYEDHYMKNVAFYIEKNKFHSTRELDITVPRYGEDPSFVMESLKHNLDLDDHFEPRALNRKQFEMFLLEKKKLLSLVPFYKQKNMEHALLDLRKILWWREELRDLSTQFYYYVRRFTLFMARHFKNLSIIDTEDDIFFLPVSDIIAISKQKISVEQARKMIDLNKVYYHSFRNYNNPNEIGRSYAKVNVSIDVGKKKYTGIACSSGFVMGKIKVIRDINDASRLSKGDILVTKFTDPGWTPKFSLLSGVITESGGLLSHAAVISREYGIPAILAVENITTLLTDGQEISIDGDNGILTLMG